MTLWVTDGIRTEQINSKPNTNNQTRKCPIFIKPVLKKSSKSFNSETVYPNFLNWFIELKHLNKR